MVSGKMSTEEREILEKFERGELRTASSVEHEIETARQAARNTFNKTRRVNLRVTERDFSLAHGAGAGGGHSVSDAFVERHPQIPVGSAGREEIGRTSWRWNRKQKGCSARSSERVEVHDPQPQTLFCL